MAQTHDVQIRAYSGSLLALDLLSGGSTTLLLSSFGSTSATTVTENNGNLAVGEAVSLGDGRTATVLGSGTAQPGVNLLGLIVATGTAVPFVILQDASGEILFLYPESAPNLTGSVALIVTATTTDYAFADAVICFAKGTLIETEKGDRPVEELSVGDLVMTADDALQPLMWIGQNTLDVATLAFKDHLRPIRIRAGALGAGLPLRDLLVSPQHRVLVQSRVAERMFGTGRVLVAAKHLCAIAGISRADDMPSVTYVHIMFDRHQIVFSNGAPTEALLPGPEALRCVGPEARAEILELFPDSRDLRSGPAPVRPVVPGRMGRRMAERHAYHRRPLVEAASAPCP